jgi:hypothetical protein
LQCLVAFASLLPVLLLAMLLVHPLLLLLLRILLLLVLVRSVGSGQRACVPAVCSRSVAVLLLHLLLLGQVRMHLIVCGGSI